MKECDPQASERVNTVNLTGKVSRTQGLRYTPSGTPLWEFILAVNQQAFDKKSVGYFEVQVMGSLAEELQGKIRIGKKLTVSGALWMRNYKNRNGLNVSETKVVAESIMEAI